jgi:hypothetical protein
MALSLQAFEVLNGALGFVACFSGTIFALDIMNVSI